MEMIVYAACDVPKQMSVDIQENRNADTLTAHASCYALYAVTRKKNASFEPSFINIPHGLL